jgi:hypothetical protein
VRAGVKGAAASASVFLLLLAAAPLCAQAPQATPLPLPGFVLPYEITRIVRSAGFDPLAPPLREGTTYVVRATDFRGILMRVVVDARSGAIRAVNRIVAGPEPDGQLGMLPPPYGAPPPYELPPAYGPPAYRPIDVGPEAAPVEESAMPPAPPPARLPPAVRPVSHPLVSWPPPLPRPRPAELASRKAPDDAKPVIHSGPAPAVTTLAPAPAAPVVPKNPTAPAPMNE